MRVCFLSGAIVLPSGLSSSCFLIVIHVIACSKVPHFLSVKLQITRKRLEHTTAAKCVYRQQDAVAVLGDSAGSSWITTVRSLLTSHSNEIARVVHVRRQTTAQPVERYKVASNHHSRGDEDPQVACSHWRALSPTPLAPSANMPSRKMERLYSRQLSFLDPGWGRERRHCYSAAVVRALPTR